MHDMTEELTLRIATPDDAADLSALVNSAYRGEGSKKGWTTEAELLGGQRVDVEGLVQAIAEPDSVILLHERDRRLVACVLLERTGDSCYLGMLTVDPNLQAAGIGQRLLAGAERWAVDHWSSRAMEMTVLVQRTVLIAWYERHGYARTGKRKAFPYDDPRFGIPLRPDLEFEVLRKPLTS
jgi:ribosomal protein S18 acetylase RimI-like enzyme